MRLRGLLNYREKELPPVLGKNLLEKHKAFGSIRFDAYLHASTPQESRDISFALVCRRDGRDKRDRM